MGVERIWGGAPLYHCCQENSLFCILRISLTIHSFSFLKTYNILAVMVFVTVFKSLEALYLPSMVTQIGDDASRNCKSLRIIIVPECAQYICLDI